jgi:hypothetical protein
VLLEDVEVPFAHYLVENKIWWDPTHILCSVLTSMPLIVLPAKQNQRELVIFISLYEINIHVAPTFNHLMEILNIYVNLHKMVEGRYNI